MLSDEDIEKIETLTKEFFERLGFEVEIEFLPSRELTLPINLKTEFDSATLIGEQGKTLTDIQHILKAILKRKINDDFYIDLDINGYKQKKVEYLKELTRSIANEVALTKKEKILPSMSAYERRIIHLEISGRKDVTSESIGQEPERKVVIKPYP